ncbi:MAG: hypothetical protein OXU20_21415 [Myxococcales bacterium]|nr:hypothetical protein [Myxococcales bacterium]MDD9971035.1 hypothetical protein [Myxococcales bacterium]
MKRPPKSGHTLAILWLCHALATAWLAALIGSSVGMYTHTMGEGVTRFALVFALWLTGVGAHFAFTQAANKGVAPILPGVPRARWIMAAIASALFAYHVFAGVSEIRRTGRLNAIHLDQGQIVYRAIRLMPDHNPYSRTLLLDPIYYITQIKRHFDSGCLRFDIPQPAPGASRAERIEWIGEMIASVKRFWWDLDLTEMRRLMPNVIPGTYCDDARFGFESLGFKYGPVTLVSYVPTVLLWDKPGVFVTQMVYFVAICATLLTLGRVRTGQGRAAALLPLVVALALPHLRENLLEASALDGPPTLFSLLALLLHWQRRPSLSAVSLGLALACKPLPGLLYLPLLLGTPPRNLLICLGTAVTPYLGFVVWDAWGVWNNVVLFALTRGTEATSLAHYLPPAGRAALTGSCAGLILLTLVRAYRRGFGRADQIAYLFSAHLGVLAGAPIMRNNYLVWLSPVLALQCLELWQACRGSQSGSRTGHPLKAAAAPHDRLDGRTDEPV